MRSSPRGALICAWRIAFRKAARSSTLPLMASIAVLVHRPAVYADSANQEGNRLCFRANASVKALFSGVSRPAA